MCFRLCFCRFCAEKKELRVNRPVLLYVAYAAAVSLLHRSEFGVNSLLLNYIFGLYLVVLCANFGADLSKDDWLDIVSGAASILMIVILIKKFDLLSGIFGLSPDGENGAPMGRENDHRRRFQH